MVTWKRFFSKGVPETGGEYSHQSLLHLGHDGNTPLVVPFAASTMPDSFFNLQKLVYALRIF